MITDDDASTLFCGRYRIPSTRKPGWDYGRSGYYFVTICTRGRVPWLGEVHHARMCLSEVGSIVHQCWQAIPRHHAYVFTDQFIVMPDHIHGIVRLDHAGSMVRREEQERMEVVETRYIASLHHPTQPNTFGPLRPGSLPSIVHSFKAAVTRLSRRQGFDFAWQPRFHDHVIRDEEALDCIRRYIRNNPVAWWERHGGGF